MPLILAYVAVGIEVADGVLAVRQGLRAVVTTWTTSFRASRPCGSVRAISSTRCSDRNGSEAIMSAPGRLHRSCSSSSLILRSPSRWGPFHGARLRRASARSPHPMLPAARGLDLKLCRRAQGRRGAALDAATRCAAGVQHRDEFLFAYAIHAAPGLAAAEPEGHSARRSRPMTPRRSRRIWRSTRRSAS